MKGFTLIELLVVIAVTILMAGWAIPSLQAFTARHQVATEVLRIKTALAQTKNTAVTRRTDISVCPSRDQEACLSDWTAPLMIIQGRADGGSRGADEPILKVLPASEVATITFRNGSSVIRFPATGWPRGYNGTFNICGNHGQAAQVVMSNLGRVRTAGKGEC
ncbi:prepilin-type N-terminal cleavage/methylation domain-containing protein [Litchfieldella qijiaojingensis]|uniref:Type II secretion system protein H n=1 Tax=Litchfieldella qijiaojingensis TaxID=980347 RepID=A0ABQ2Z6Z0_9GAMM|nr:GspH/FimT family pseudopilin [Halomonas qijiaojingensis]GGY03706.1 prepilin-type N-terminal cleavage/methylation domain-containing protein [Halomonas qijiaojingensis]